MFGIPIDFLLKLPKIFKKYNFLGEFLEEFIVFISILAHDHKTGCSFVLSIMISVSKLVAFTLYISSQSLIIHFRGPFTQKMT